MVTGFNRQSRGQPGRLPLIEGVEAEKQQKSELELLARSKQQRKTR